jgi:outer membrane protein assembly factor BamD
VLLLVVAAAGCSHPGKGLSPGTYERGLVEFDDGRYYEAIEDLKLFIRRNPTDDRVEAAQMHIGLARYQDEDYPVAAVEFEILRNDYPNSEFVEEAWYMQGMCFVKQVPRLDQEQSVTVEGITHFERFLAEFPESARRADAERELAALWRHLDKKQLSAVELYRDLGKKRAALVTLEVLLEDRPRSELRPRLLFLAAELHKELGETEAAQRRLDQLAREFPDHELTRRTKTGGGAGDSGSR